MQWNPNVRLENLQYLHFYQKLSYITKTFHRIILLVFLHLELGGSIL